MAPAARKLLAVLLSFAACASGVVAALAAASPSGTARTAHASTRRHRGCRAHRHGAHRRSRCRGKHHVTAKKPGAPTPAGGVTGTPPQAGPPTTTTTTTPGSVEAPAGGKPPQVARVQVTAVEYGFTLSRSTVPAGKVIVEFVNKGQDEHNLNVLGGEGELSSSFANEVSGGIKDQAVVLKPGSYTLFCSLPEHEQKGMKATLLVQ